MRFSVFQLSRKGGREKNEDRMGYCYTKSSGLFLLADGMGGHPEGEVASQMALQVISALYQKEARPELPNVREFFDRAILAAHRQILRYAAEKNLLDTPRTTLVAAVLQGGYAHWVHCGDSRLYFVRKGELLVRTRDHSYAEQHEMQRHGTGGAPVNRNLLFTCLGSPTRPVYDVTGPVTLHEDDRMLLCSDGLWGPMHDTDIVYHMANKSVSQAAPDLVELALVNGGPRSDNVTVIALKWETPDPLSQSDGTISTDSISEGVFASTVQAAWADAVEDDMDEEAIERSIAEIKEAIRLSAARKQ